MFFLLFSPVCRSLAQTEIALAPWFGDGMVLQQGANALLQGSGPPGKTLSFTFSGGTGYSFWHHTRPSTTLVDGSGHWRLSLDLSGDEYQDRDKLWTLRIEEAKRGKYHQDYHDVRIGDVIIVAGWENQGLPADKAAFVSSTAALFEHNKDAIRFLDLTNADFNANPKHAAGARWENWPKDTSEFSRYSTLKLRLAYELAECKIQELSDRRYIGIVFISRNVLTNALVPGGSQAPNGFKCLDDKIWQWIADDACEAQIQRAQTLIFNKRHNIITNPPPVVAYDPARLGSWECFDSQKPPRASFAFAGAIWSVPPD